MRALAVTAVAFSLFSISSRAADGDPFEDVNRQVDAGHAAWLARTRVDPLADIPATATFGDTEARLHGFATERDWMTHERSSWLQWKLNDDPVFGSLPWDKLTVATHPAVRAATRRGFRNDDVELRLAQWITLDHFGYLAWRDKQRPRPLTAEAGSPTQRFLTLRFRPTQNDFLLTARPAVVARLPRQLRSSFADELTARGVWVRTVPTAAGESAQNAAAPGVCRECTLAPPTLIDRGASDDTRTWTYFTWPQFRRQWPELPPSFELWTKPWVRDMVPVVTITAKAGRWTGVHRQYLRRLAFLCGAALVGMDGFPDY